MAGYLGTKAVFLSTTAADVTGNAEVGGDLTVDTDTLYVDSTNNRVGVGTSSPIYAADIKTSGTNNGQLRVGGAGTSATGLLFEQTNSGSTTANIQNSYYSTSASASLSIKSGFTTFHTGTAGTERMRLDASGNLLVGTTDNNVGNNSGSSNSGFNITSSGEIKIASASGSVFNRLATDGNMIDFKKDGSTVGSIGVYTDRVYLATTSKGVCIDQSAARMIPTDASGNNNDANMDLGQSNGRWKDLYLSGGVYLGGTGSANYLDDYEEGTFTPDLAFGGNSVGITYNNRNGVYKKVGSLVYVSVAISLTNKGSSTGDATIRNLPFQVFNGSAYEDPALSVAYMRNMSSATAFNAAAGHGFTFIELNFATASGNNPVDNGDFTNTSAFNVSGWYYVSE